MRKRITILALSLTLILSCIPCYASDALAEQRDNVPSGSVNAQNVQESGHDIKNFDNCSLMEEGAGSYTIKVYGTFDQVAAYNVKKAIKSRTGKDLIWNSGLEDYAMSRAAEISVYYAVGESPVGTMTNEDWIGVGYKTATEFINDLDYSKLCEAIDNIGPYVGVGKYTAKSGTNYWTLVFYTSPLGGSDSTAIKDSISTSVTINVDDDHFDWFGLERFTNYSSTYTYSPKSTYKGKTYYKRLYVSNYVPVLGQTDEYPLYSFKATSSNTAVASISSTGKITAKRAGVTTIKCSPSSSSNCQYYVSTKMVVRPSKISGVKLSTPKAKAIKISWTRQAGVSGYKIYRSTKRSSGYKLIKTVSGSTSSYTNTSLKRHKTYYYKVKGYVRSNSTNYYGAYSTAKYKTTK